MPLGMADDAPQMVGDTPMRRMDLAALCKRIQNALGPEKWHKYWSVFQRYIRFKLSKEELENGARTVLGNDNVALHNQLVRGILQNAIINTVHPPAVETHVGPDPFDPPPRQDKKKKKKIEVSTAAPGLNTHAHRRTHARTPTHPLTHAPTPSNHPPNHPPTQQQSQTHHTNKYTQARGKTSTNQHTNHT